MNTPMLPIDQAITLHAIARKKLDGELEILASHIRVDQESLAVLMEKKNAKEDARIGERPYVMLSLKAEVQ